MVEGCKKIDRCRVCGSHALDLVIDMGEQCLSGQFPLIGEPDPPAFPLVLVRCSGGCGLVQLAHTVNPELMFNDDYGYRSSLTGTMRKHLLELSFEAEQLVGRNHRLRILDIGGNDGQLLASFHEDNIKWLIDPFDGGRPLRCESQFNRVKDFFPCKLPRNDFDLIFTIACFYDSDDPVAFARAVRDNLAPDGIWCVEVAHLPAMIGNLSYDTICHEHLAYYDDQTLLELMKKSGLRPIQITTNTCNGGSVRVYACREECMKYRTQDIGEKQQFLNFVIGKTIVTFRWGIERHREELLKYLIGRQHRKQRVHLLGASTKSNTVLQYAGVDPGLIQYASDRDPRKKGRKTPGAGIPIISEEESRAMRPDVYLSCLSHFKSELLAREQDYLKGGGKIAFLLPRIEEVGG